MVAQRPFNFLPLVLLVVVVIAVMAILPQVGSLLTQQSASVQISVPAAQSQAAAATTVTLYDEMAGLPIALESELVATDWTGNIMMSTRHPESDRLIRGVIARAAGMSLVSINPEGCQNGQMSNGTICLFASLTPPADGSNFEGHVAILMGVSKYVAFMVVSGTVRQTPPMPGESGWYRLGESQYYMQQSSMFWNCAWWFGERISNGHGIAPEQYWLDAGASWERWQIVKQRYGMTFPIYNIALPSWGGN